MRNAPIHAFHIESKKDKPVYEFIDTTQDDPADGRIRLEIRRPDDDVVVDREKWIDGIPESVWEILGDVAEPKDGIMPNKSSLEGDGTVVLQSPDGSRERRSGGSRSWRNKNPGNVTAGPLATRHGSIGSDLMTGQKPDPEKPPLAIFPDFKTGLTAMFAFLKRPIYQRLAVGDAIRQYAGKDSKSAENYVKFVVKRSGLDPNTPMVKLTDEQLWTMIKAMIRFERYTPGETIRLNKTGQRYIWRTRRDSQVRSEHAEREGKVFDWNNPPKGGNPGEDYGCRCWAEPYPFWDA
ncbi:MAG: hypothetical protein HZA02_00725 [Nitrospinae bacterium]|nr:hypothetical protein [Nitrospinota bacterium]